MNASAQSMLTERDSSIALLDCQFWLWPPESSGRRLMGIVGGMLLSTAIIFNVIVIVAFIKYARDVLVPQVRFRPFSLMDGRMLRFCTVTIFALVLAQCALYYAVYSAVKTIPQAVTLGAHRVHVLGATTITSRFPKKMCRPDEP